MISSVFSFSCRRVFPLVLCGLMLVWSSSVHAATPPVVEVTSKSGLKAWLIEDHKLPLVSLRFAFRGGVERDPADKQGLAVLAASLLTQGAGPYDDAAFQELLAERSIQLDISASRDFIEGEVKTLAREKKEAFRLLGLALMQPRFQAEALERTRRQQLTAQKLQKAKPDWQGRYALYRLIFGEHPYGFRSFGTQQSLSSLTQEDARSFLRHRLTRDKLLVSVVGAITPQELSAALDSVFAALPASDDEAALPPVVWPDEPHSVLVRREGTQTNIQFALPMLRRDDPDWYAAEVANYILGGGGFVSRLMKDVRARAGLTYGIGTGLASMDKASMLSGQLASDNDKAAEAWALVLKVWRRFVEEGVTPDEVESARAYLIGSLPLALTSTDALSDVLLMMQKENLGPTYLEDRQAKLAAVTVQDVQRVIAAWFNPDHLNVSFVGAPQGLAVSQTTDMILE